MGRAYYNEFDAKAAAWLRELIKGGHIAEGDVDERSILDVRPVDLAGYTQCHFFAGIGGWSYALRLAGWPDDRPVWTGSPPCQPFSSAGRNLGRDDERHLGPHLVSLVRACRPAVLFGEQVASAAVFGPAAKGNRPGFEGTPPWAWVDDLFDRLEAARYAAWASDIPSAGIGAPHIRQRTFFGAVDLERLAEADDAGSQGRRQPGRERAAELAPGAGGMASRVEHAPRDGRDEWRAGADGRGLAAGCGAGGLAESDRGQRDGVTDGEERQPDRAATRWQQGDSKPERGGQCGGLADTGRDGPRGGFGDSSEAPGLSQGQCRAEQRADVSDGRREGDGGRGLYGGDGLPGNTARPYAPDSPWSTPDWLFCRDGKWRPVEPGTFPLASGLPARVGRLRGYGNAINPWCAKVFIEGSLAALQELAEAQA